MTRKPVCIREDALAVEALKVFDERDIDDLIVVNAKREPVGLVIHRIAQIETDVGWASRPAKWRNAENRGFPNELNELLYLCEIRLDT